MSDRRKVKQRELRWYQTEAVEKATLPGRRGIFLGMQMRLGKSLTALRIAKKLRYSCGIIVAPKIVLLGWESELKAEGFRFQNLCFMNLKERIAHLRNWESADGFVLINHESFSNREVTRTLDKLKPFPFQTLILDESTNAKNARAKSTKSLIRICDRFDYAMALSGLATPKDWLDIWSQMAILFNGRWMGCGSFWQWRKRHTAPSESGYGVELTSDGREAIHAVFRKDSYCITREEAGLKEESVTQILSGELTPEAKKIQSHILKNWATPGIGDTNGVEFCHVPVVDMALRRLCSGHVRQETEPARIETWKTEQIKKIAEEFKNERLVVWCAFNGEIEDISNLLGKRVIPLTGEASMQERRQALDEFIEGGNAILVCQLKLGRFGLNLSKASVTVYYSLSYDLVDYGQSHDRTVMPGKKDVLTYIHLVTKNTIEEDIYHAVISKRADAKALMARKMVECRSRSRGDWACTMG